MGGRRTSNPKGSVVLRKRKDGAHAWMYRWVDAKGSYRGVQFATVADFRTKSLAWHEAERLRLPQKYLGMRDVEKQGRKTFAHLIERYRVEEIPGRFSTEHGYNSWLTKHIGPRWDACPIESVDPLAVEQWLKGLDLAPKSKSHIKGLMTILLNRAMAWGWIPIARNPMELVKIVGGVRRKSRPQVMTPEQFGSFLSHVSDEYIRLVVIISMCLGLRFSEVLALKWSDVDWENLLLTIERGIVQGRIGPVKTEYSDAPATLDPELAEILLGWQRQSYFSQPADWIFASPAKGGAQPYFPTGVRRKIHTAAKAAGLGKLFKGEPTKIMRHSYRSWLGTTDTPIGVIKGMMRHGDIRTTMNVYGKEQEEPMRRAGSKVVKMALRIGGE